MTEVDEIPEIPSLEDTNDNILDVDGAVEEVIEDKALSPLKSVSKPTKHEVQEDPQVEEEVEEQLLQPIDTSSHQSTRVDSPSPEVVEEEVPPADSHLHDTQPATHEDIFEIFDQDHPKSSRKMDKEVISSPRKENSNHNSGTNSPVTSGKKKMVIKSDSPHRRKVDEDDDNHHKSPTTSPVKKLSLHDDKVVIEMTASDIAEEAVKSARDSLEKKKEDVPESASNDVTPPNTLEEHAKSSHPTGSSATPSPMKKKKVPSPSPVKEIQSQKEKEVMAEEAEKIALQAKQSRLNAQKELKEHRLQQRKQQLSLLAKEKKEKENDEQSKDGVSKEPVKEKKSGIPRRKSNPAPKAAASTEPNPTEGQEDGQIKLPAIAAKPVQSSAQRLQRRINAARDKSDVNKASLPAGRRSAEKLPRLVQVSKDDSHEEDNGDERDHEEGNGHGKRPPRSSPDGGGETVTKKKKPLYLRMIAKAQKKIVEEERKKHEEYLKLKQSRSNHVPTRDELKEHRSKFDEMLKLKAEEQHRNHVNNIRALRKARQVNGLNEDGSVADSEATPMSSPQKSMMTPQKETHSPLKKRNYQTPKNELSSLSPSKSQNNHDGDVGEIPHMDELISKSSMDEGDGVSLGVVGQSSKKSTRSPRAMYNSPRIGKTKSQDANDTSMEKGLDSEPTSPKASPRSPRNHHKLPGSTSRKKMPSRKSMELTDEEDNTSPEEKHGKNKEKFNFTLKEVDVASICPDDWMHRLLASTMSVDDLHGEAPLLD